MLGKGMSLFFFINSFTINNDPMRVTVDNSDSEYFMMDSKKTISLIAGVNTTKTSRSYLSKNET